MHRQWGDKQLLCKKNLKEMGRGFKFKTYKAGKYQQMYD